MHYMQPIKTFESRVAIHCCLGERYNSAMMVLGLAFCNNTRKADGRFCNRFAEIDYQFQFSCIGYHVKCRLGLSSEIVRINFE